MTVTILIPSPLRRYCGGLRDVTLAGETVREALRELERGHPTLYTSVCDETGAVRRHVNLFVNSSHIRDLAGLDTGLVPGDTVTILPAVSGG